MISMKFIRSCKLKNSRLGKSGWMNSIEKIQNNSQYAGIFSSLNSNVIVKHITGLINLGNSSYINASLQCIIHAIPFYNFCLREKHVRNCIKQDFCSFCLIEKLINYIYLNNNLATEKIFEEIQNISSKIKINQPDPHEFIQALLFSMHNCSLYGFKEKLKFNKIVEYTTPIHHFWGSTLRSIIKCCNCYLISHVDKSIFGLSLHVQKSSLVKTLEKYFQTNNPYEKKKFCKNCKKKHGLVKKITFLKSPLILYIRLKQFKFSQLIRKLRISRLPIFELALDISKFFFKCPRLPIRYDLFSVLVNSENCNKKYYSYCKLFSRYSKTWYCIKDLNIFRVPIRTVINSRAYIICYQREHPSMSNSSVNKILKTKMKQTKIKMKKLKNFNSLKNDFLVRLRLQLLHVVGAKS